MKINQPARAAPEDFADSPDWFKKYLVFQNAFNQASLLATQGNLGIDNFAAQYVSAKLYHGVEQKIANPLALATPPLAPIDVRCASAVVGGLGTSSPSYLPAIQWRVCSDGQIGVTALYPLAEQFGSLVATAGQLLSGAGSTLITFPALATTSIGANIAYDGSSKLIAGKKGLYQVWYQATFQFNASGTRDAWISVNGSGDYGLQGVFTNTYSAEGTYLSGSDVLLLNAGDFIQLVQYANGQSVNINTSVVAAYAPRLRMRQLSNDASLFGNVTLKITGG